MLMTITARRPEALPNPSDLTILLHTRRSLGQNCSLARRECAPNFEGERGTTARESLWPIRQHVLGVSAIESEPINPRLRASS
ncbi:hypothetical protein ACTHRK_19215 [Dietzia cercidiphylli]|uniref:hypothetical protein n=1 Tax=Dietzia TaxID=37914 RepID=UPI0011F8C640|nr:hypothetical protein [Dietzia sp. CW19]MBB1052212.1 hypothetical protein [Dietzia sp. CW19]TKW69156.1 MAG: hypothetical protein DI580_13415 [Cutibacterium acnes]